MRSAHLLAGSILAAMAPLAASQSNGDEQFLKQYAVTVAKVAAGFVNLAGSEDNAVALVEALYHAQPVQLDLPAGLRFAISSSTVFNACALTSC